MPFPVRETSATVLLDQFSALRRQEHWFVPHPLTRDCQALFIRSETWRTVLIFLSELLISLSSPCSHVPDKCAQGDES